MAAGGAAVREQDRSRPWRTDGTARSAPRPSTRPAANHIFPRPHMCSESTTGNSDTRVARSWRKTSGSRESDQAGSLSWVQLREPERCLHGLLAKVGERYLEGRRSGDQNHVISYSQAGQRRIRSEQLDARQLANPTP